jgi:NAD+ kinase
MASNLWLVTLGTMRDMRRIGLVVHPSRNVDAALQVLRAWAAEHDAETVQVQVPGQHQRVAEPGDAADCDLVVAVGGDGTMLAAIHLAAAADRPVLGVACGSLGVLTSVTAEQLTAALDRVARGEWTATSLPALQVDREGGGPLLAFNDLAIVRHGQGQVRAIVKADGVLFTRFAGDGCIVSTPVGSSGYTLAAGGPLLAPGLAAFVMTPLNVHGGSRAPLVLGAQSELELSTRVGYGGARVEVDGQVGDVPMGWLRVRFKPSAATVVTFADQEPLLTGLRRRQILVDSPRIIAEDGRV